MTVEALTLLAAGAFAVALLYSSVGHAGASGYIAIMSLFGIAPAEIKPTALALNILVASIASWQFWRAGRFSWPLFWPFAALSVPMAFAGGYLDLPVHVFKILVGAMLLWSALVLFLRPPHEREPRTPPKSIAVCTGAGIGLLSGLTGTGGGIFLTPLMVLRHWAGTRAASGVSAPFILLNSVAALAGNFSATKNLPSFALPLAAAVVVGGTLGSYAGSRRLQPVVIRRLLAAVLTIAGAKLILA